MRGFRMGALALLAVFLLCGPQLFGQEDEPPFPRPEVPVDAVEEADPGSPAPPEPVPEEPQPGSYEEYLTRLVSLEEKRLWQEADEESLTGIRRLIEELSLTPYTDLEAEGRLMEFLILRAREERRQQAGLEDFLASLEEEEARRQKEKKRIKRRHVWTGITLGSSLLALGGFNYLRHMGNETYESYLEANAPQEASYYQGWWQTWDLASVVTAGVGLVSFTTFLILLGSGR